MFYGVLLPFRPFTYSAGAIEQRPRFRPTLRNKAMFKGIADPEKLGALRQALDQYCLAHDITGRGERHHIAMLIVRLFGRGLTSAKEIGPALEKIVARGA
jgi:hypothetical protein